MWMYCYKVCSKHFHILYLFVKFPNKYRYSLNRECILVLFIFLQSAIKILFSCLMLIDLFSMITYYFIYNYLNFNMKIC